MPKNNDDKSIRCSFCGKYSSEVERMIAGPGVYICNECVELCNDVLYDEPSYRGEHSSRPNSRKASAPVPQQEIPRPEEIKKEYLLPVLVDLLIKNGRLKVRMLKTDSVWFGVTYREDQPYVEQELRQLHKAGVYPSQLWNIEQEEQS